MFKRQTIGLVSLLLVLGWGGMAQADNFLLAGSSAGQNQIGTGLPLPLGPAGIFLGGMTMTNGGTSCGNPPNGCGQSPDGPGTAFWPPLSVPPNPNISTGGGATRVIFQNQATAAGGTIVIPPLVLIKAAPGAPAAVGVFTTNPALLQVATTISYGWPSDIVAFGPGRAPGGMVLGTAGGGFITYSGGTKAFGGSGQFTISAGPGAAGGRVPPNTMGTIPIASVWFALGQTPGNAMTIGIAGAAAAPDGLGQNGATVDDPGYTSMFGPVTMGFGLVNQTNCCTVNQPSGLLDTMTPSIQVSMAFPSNMVTISKGFPWTTGLITISAEADPLEVFFLSGTDMRVAGVGNVSLVSGALSQRQLSGPNANRGWLSLDFVATAPEPSVALGLGGALAMLALCHGLVRRRSH